MPLGTSRTTMIKIDRKRYVTILFQRSKNKTVNKYYVLEMLQLDLLFCHKNNVTH